MKIIDLSLPIYSGMPVFPGDPEVEIQQLQTLGKDSWNMKRIHMNSHDGTHVNVPIHATANGKDLDSYKIEDFIGPALLYESPNDIQPGIGVIFAKQNVNEKIAKIIAKDKPKFIGLSADFEFDIAVEKFLLEKGIISFEKLANTKLLPEHFMFYGVPLNFREGDGSPVRAFASPLSQAEYESEKETNEILAGPELVKVKKELGIHMPSRHFRSG